MRSEPLLAGLQADVLGPDYRVETFSLPPDSEGPVVATLVTLAPERPNGRAVLHVHGFADYFFHTEYARWWADRGYTFYGLDLRKYGRSLREHQTPHYVADLSEYFAEIDLAWWRITQRDGHSRGDRVGTLDRRPHAPALGARTTARRAVARWCSTRRGSTCRARRGCAARRPGSRSSGSAPVARCRRSPAASTSVYGRSLHREHGGEWDYDLDWKPLPSRPIYVGWLRAVRRGHAQLHAGLDIACPTLVLSSARSHFGEQTERDRRHPRHRARRRADPALGLLGGPPRHLGRDRGRHPRRGAVASRRARSGVRRRSGTWLDAWVEVPGSGEQGDERGRRRRGRSPLVAARAAAVVRPWRRSGRRRPSRGRSGRRPASRLSATAMKTTAATALTMSASTFLVAVWRCIESATPMPRIAISSTPCAAPK